MIVVTQLPFVATLVISFFDWNALYPEARALHRLRQLQRGARPTRTCASSVLDDDPADGRRGARQPGARPAPGPAAGPQLPGPRRGPHPADRAVPAWSRWPRRCSGSTCSTTPSTACFNGLLHWIVGRPAARLGLQDAAARRRGLPGVAVDAVHDADPAGGAAEPSDREQVEAAWVDGASDWQVFRYIYAAAPAPLPGTGRPARLDLHRPELRRRLHDHLRRPGHREPAVHRLPDFYQAHENGLASAAGVLVVIGSIIIATFALRVVSSLFREEAAHERHGSAVPAPGRSPPPGEGEAGPGTAPRACAGGTLARPGLARGILFFLPIAWMALTSLPLRDGRRDQPAVLRRRRSPSTATASSSAPAAGASPWPALVNSLAASVASTLLVLLLACPAAYALSIRPVKKWTDVLFFFLSTKMLPVVAGLLPIYLFAKNTGMLDNIWLLVILYTSMNLPIAVWMMQSFLAEVPGRADRGGADRRRPAADDPRPRRRPDRHARHRRDVADLLHLQLERDALRPGADRRGRRDRARLPDRIHHQPGPVPGEGVRRVARHLPAGARRGVRRPGQAGPGPVAWEP